MHPADVAGGLEDADCLPRARADPAATGTTMAIANSIIQGSGERATSASYHGLPYSLLAVAVGGQVR